MKLFPIYQKISPHLQSFVLLFVRITIGWGFFLTGKGKLMNLERTTNYFASLRLPAPKFQAMMAGTTEMVGGALLMIGLCTRLISFPLVITMIVAYLTAHRDEAFISLSDFTDQDPFAFLMAALVTMAFGAGKFSLDAKLQPFVLKKLNVSPKPHE